MKKNVLSILLFTFIIESAMAQWSMISMSNVRMQLSSPQKDDKIYFAGGFNGFTLSDLIEVYNTSSETWEPSASLSSPRSFTAGVAGDSALYIAGGIEALTSVVLGSNKVDILKNGIWSTHYLPDSFFTASAVHVGSKILIAGGARRYNSSNGSITASNIVEVFDETTGLWSTDTLSEARIQVAAASDGVTAIFAGGLKSANLPSDVVDIYNSVTDTWSTATLSVARANVCGVYCNGRFFFAGGATQGVNNSSDVVDMYDGTNWTVDHLSQPRGGISACSVDNHVVFAGGGNINLPAQSYTTSSSLVDVFNTVNGTWSSNNMGFERVNHTSVSANGKVYVAGGYDISFQTPLDAVEIWDMVTSVNTTENVENVSVYPNPSRNQIRISNYGTGKSIVSAKIIDYMNRVVLSVKLNNDVIDISCLPAGLYFLEIQKEDRMVNLKFIKE